MIPIPPRKRGPNQSLPSSGERQRGRVAKWDDDKGFGFIEPEQLGPDVFLHIKALADRARRPAVGAAVSFRTTSDEKGRLRAVEARLESGGRPARALLWCGAVVAAFLGMLALAVALGALSLWVPVTYLVMSSLTFAAYASDKLHAERGARRTPEGTLHLLELLGGWPGALLAQEVLRHKTSKTSYQLVFWLVTVAHLGFWAWLALGRPGW
ncbi:MAG: cold shock and DUF1294 domain-containing protein [Chthoniobacter sp.]|nr:cold shock and DUF1294 domain-containing protein [Chthoniobacter sp.]